MLQKELSESIGFHNRFQKYQGCIAFDVSNCGKYIVAAINFWVISEDDMLKNVTKILKDKAKTFTYMEWPPHPY